MAVERRYWYYECPEHMLPFFAKSKALILNNLRNHLVAKHDLSWKEALIEAKTRLGIE